MKAPSDSRFAFLRDPDLYDLVGRLALKRVRNEASADDVRNGAYVVAMQLVLGGRGPKPGTERGWMCRVARNHTFEALRARKEEEKPLETDDEPDIPVADQPTLLAHQMEVERRFTVVEEVASQHPEHVAEALGDDARTKKRQGDAKDAAARKRKERARTFLASAVSSALAVVIAILWFRGPGAPKPALPAGGYATRRGRRLPARRGELRGAKVDAVPRRSRATQEPRRLQGGSARAGGARRGGRGDTAGGARGVHEERLHDVPRGARHGEAVRSGRRDGSERAAREKRGGAAAEGNGGAGAVEEPGCEAGAAAVGRGSCALTSFGPPAWPASSLSPHGVAARPRPRATPPTRRPMGAAARAVRAAASDRAAPAAPAAAQAPTPAIARRGACTASRAATISASSC